MKWRDRLPILASAIAENQPAPISTIRRTGRLLAPLMPVSSSTFPAAAAVYPGDDVADQHVNLCRRRGWSDISSTMRATMILTAVLGTNQNVWLSQARGY